MSKRTHSAKAYNGFPTIVSVLELLEGGETWLPKGISLQLGIPVPEVNDALITLFEDGEITHSREGYFRVAFEDTPKKEYCYDYP